MFTIFFPYNNESTNILSRAQEDNNDTSLLFIIIKMAHKRTNKQALISLSYLFIAIYLAQCNHLNLFFCSAKFHVFTRLAGSIGYTIFVSHTDFYPVLKPLIHFTDDHHNKVFFLSDFRQTNSNKRKENKRKKKKLFPITNTKSKLVVLTSNRSERTQNTMCELTEL